MTQKNSVLKSAIPFWILLQLLGEGVWALGYTDIPGFKVSINLPNLC